MGRRFLDNWIGRCISFCESSSTHMHIIQLERLALIESANQSLAFLKVPSSIQLPDSESLLSMTLNPSREIVSLDSTPSLSPLVLMEPNGYALARLPLLSWEWQPTSKASASRHMLQFCLDCYCHRYIFRQRCYCQIQWQMM